ncbi:vitronectin b [Gadus chalcogrammus]|uniref:vitronectin b n=1 Tax=Gadus chalcogrammus TaxID=1042646 RepID=UPI0024C29B00|nr:vitronectin b [Gadus chalcogrammus]
MVNMRLGGQVLWVLWVLALHAAFAAEESCEARCGVFDAQRRCQCDSMCVYHQSCCQDFQSVCRRKAARGDTFGNPDDLYPTGSSMDGADVTTSITPSPTTTGATPDPTTTGATPNHTTRAPVAASPSDPDQVSCSGRAFDAFLQQKNGSVYAFRGEYFFELDESSVLHGNPKLIKDFWGIHGPIDAAFTRINCQGKSYIFKGNQYWRFEGHVLDDDYPRDISVGFENMPSDVDAAFAIPAPSLSGKEKVYFFKGDQYHQYEFKFQPSHEECVTMTRSSPSVKFTHYTQLYHDQLLEEMFAELFRGPFQGQSKGPRLISSDWLGIKPPIDAAMVGRLYLSPKSTPTTPVVRPSGGRRGSKKRRGRGHRRRSRQRGRHSRSVMPDFYSYFQGAFYGDLSSDNYGSDYFSSDYYANNYGAATTTAPPGLESLPVQNVYFFKKDKYYRANLKSKRVDRVTPPYPRSIASYWLGCDAEEPTASRAERRR